MKINCLFVCLFTNLFVFKVEESVKRSQRQKKACFDNSHKVCLLYRYLSSTSPLSA